MRKTTKQHGIWIVPAAVLVIVLFLTALANLDSGRRSEDKKQLEEALRNACMVCYSVEGTYPPSLDYLEQRYGISVDRERFTVVYEAIGANLMPDITVLEQ
ncbi:MAG: hypothetical protein IJ486_06110 [Firmicutes bacterium]|nr:hypothetical protein [Bacillota bacterium]